MGHLFSQNFSLLEDDIADETTDLETNTRNLNLLKFSQTGLFYGPTFLIDQNLSQNVEPIPFFEAVEQESHTNFLEEALNDFATNNINNNTDSDDIHFGQVEVIKGNLNISSDSIRLKLVSNRKEQNPGSSDRYLVGTVVMRLKSSCPFDISVNLCASVTGNNSVVEKYSGMPVGEYHLLEGSDCVQEIEIPLLCNTSSRSGSDFIQLLQDPNGFKGNLPSGISVNNNQSDICYSCVIKCTGISSDGNDENIYIVLMELGSYVGEEVAVYELKTVERYLQVNGKRFLLQDIYGYYSSSASNNEHDVEDEQEAEETFNSPDCVICLSEVKNTLVLPCRHMCLCSGCAEVIRGQCSSGQNVNLNKCPICRQTFHSLLQVDHVNPDISIGNEATKEAITIQIQD